MVEQVSKWMADDKSQASYYWRGKLQINKDRRLE